MGTETVSRTALRISKNVSASTVGTLRRRAAAVVAEAGAPDSTVDAIRLCVSEALTNVAIHAYPDRPGVVELVVEVEEDEYVVTVRDWGRGIGARLGRPEDGGLGLGIIDRLSLRYRITSGSDGGTEICMVFTRGHSDPFLSP